MRFGIRQKLLLLIAVLSLALIAASVLIASQRYSASLEQNTKKLCEETADSLIEVIESDHRDFIVSYKSKIEAVYKENREELEAASETEFESFDKREEFYDGFMEGIFPPKQGFGVSYETLQFKLEYGELRNNMDMLAFAGGLDISSVFFYDAEHGNIVYLIDRMPEGSTLYSFPASVKKPWDAELEKALTERVASTYMAGTKCCCVKPVTGAGSDVFVLFAKQNTEIRQNVRLFLLYTLATLLGATLIIGLVMLMFANGLIVRNVKKLSEASERFTSEIGGAGLKKVSADIRSRDEIGALSDKFDLMQDSILSYISSLAEKTSREERMKAELGLAARIQKEALPAGGIKAGRAELHSFLKPAREVGGDLYDHFMLDEKRLFFCLADVSGKGIPASLFMMRAKELIKAGVMSGRSLGEFAAGLNRELCAGNEESVFITAFFGVLDTQSGRLSFLRAGHEQPLLRRGNEVMKLGEESNFVLGIFEDAEFISDEITLRAGDALLMFTDGLNEGINKEGEQFGYDRIAAAFKAAERDITGGLYGALVAFCGDAEQVDDVTMLVLTFGGNKSIVVDSPEYGDIAAVTDGVLGELCGFDPDRVSETGFIIDEVMNNEISYAFEGVDKPQIAVGLKVRGETAELTFEDNGLPFDPLCEVTDEALESSEGGNGIKLIRALSDSQVYTREGGRNRLTIIKNLFAGAKTGQADLEDER